MSYRGFFSSPGLTPHRRSDLKLLRTALEQSLLRYITCRRFLILRSEIASWPWHLSAPIELAGSRARECYYLPQIYQLKLEGYLYLLRKKNDLRPDTKLLLSVTVKA